MKEISQYGSLGEWYLEFYPETEQEKRMKVLDIGLDRARKAAEERYVESVLGRVFKHE